MNKTIVSPAARVFTVGVVLVTAALVVAQLPAPDRIPGAHSIVSRHDPAVRIELPSNAQYVGADRWVLYEIADCELHAFVETRADKIVNRLYWIQFEGYLPEKPDLHHTYDSPRHMSIGGLDFFVDTWARDSGEKTTSGSDLEHIQSLIRAKGYTLPDTLVSVRLVHLLDEQKRKELMIIYSEDLPNSGLRAADLKPGGKAYSQWPDLEASLIDRAKSRIKIEQLSNR